MPKFYIAIDQPARYNYSPVGDQVRGQFIYSGEFERKIWRGEVTDSIERLVELVNEATAMARVMNFVDLPLKVCKVISNERDPLLAAAEEISAEKAEKAAQPVEEIAPQSEPIAPVEQEIAPAPVVVEEPKPKRKLRKKADPVVEEAPEEKPAE